MAERVAAVFRRASKKVLGEVSVRPGFTNKWFDAEMKNVIGERRKAYAVWRRDEANEEAWREYKRLRHRARGLAKRKAGVMARGAAGS